MKKISLEEQKEIMLEILSAFDKYCLKHDIKYSLIGGSLIGAIRHKGIIPWDDDIDVIMMPEEYEKLQDAFSRDEFKYRFIGYNNCDNYYNPAFKIVDDSTVIEENGIKRSYGVFVDIFRYNYIPDNKLLRAIYILKYRYMIVVMHGFLPSGENESIAKRIRKLIAKTKKPIKHIDKFYAFLDKYNKKPTGHIISNSTMYSLKKEIQDTENSNGYLRVDFDGNKAYVFKNYDKILKNTFGDYMVPPPESQRVGKHDISAYKR